MDLLCRSPDHDGGVGRRVRHVASCARAGDAAVGRPPEQRTEGSVATASGASGTARHRRACRIPAGGRVSVTRWPWSTSACAWGACAAGWTGRPAARRGARPSRRLPVPLAWALAGGASAAAGLLVVETLVLTFWAADARSATGAGGALRVGGSFWLLGHGVPLSVREGHVGIMPLGLTALLLLGAARAGAGVARSATVGRDTSPAWVRGAGVGLPYGLVALLLSRLLAGDGVHSSAFLAFALPGVLSGTAAAIGASRVARAEARAAGIAAATLKVGPGLPGPGPAGRARSRRGRVRPAGRRRVDRGDLRVFASGRCRRRVVLVVLGRGGRRRDVPCRGAARSEHRALGDQRLHRRGLLGGHGHHGQPVACRCRRRAGVSRSRRAARQRSGTARDHDHAVRGAGRRRGRRRTAPAAPRQPAEQPAARRNRRPACRPRRRPARPGGNRSQRRRHRPGPTRNAQDRPRGRPVPWRRARWHSWRRRSL